MGTELMGSLSCVQARHAHLTTWTRRRRPSVIAGIALLLALPFVTAESAGAAFPAYEAIDLGTGTGDLNSYASNISNSAAVAVNSSSADGQLSHVFSWTESGGFVDIGNLGAGPIFARDINASGQIIGVSADRGFIWTPGDGIRNIGTLGGQSEAWGMNDNGVVVGYSGTNTGFHAVAWTASAGLRDLGVPAANSIAFDINNAGTIVSATLSTPRRSYVQSLSGGAPVYIGSLGGADTNARAINDAGTVMGDSQMPNGDTHAFVWSAADGMTDLGSLGGTFSSPFAISENGQVTGRAYIPGDNVEHAFYWRPVMTNMLDIPGLGGFETEGVAINNAGQVVGYSYTPTGEEHGFLWSEADGFLDLGVFGLRDAYDINENGDIAGVVLHPGPDSSTTSAVLVRPFAAPDPDADGNGIEDAIQVAGSPNSFVDTNTPTPTFGSLVNANGHSVTIADAPAPDGVRITVTGTGTTKATFLVCGFTLRLAPGSDVVVTCGSITVSVVNGDAEVDLADGHIVVTVPFGATAKLTDIGGDHYLVDNLGSAGVVTVAVDGIASSVDPGSQAESFVPPVVADTRTTLSANSDVVSVGGAVTLSAAVTTLPPGLGEPTGTVSVMDGANPVCAATPVAAGLAECMTSSLSVGNHQLVAVYSGDPTHHGSTSDAVSVQVDRVATTTTIDASPSAIVFGQPGTVTASVGATSGSPTGTLTISDGAATLCSGSAASGPLSCPTGSLPIGPHSLTATYSGDATFSNSASASTTVTVSRAATATALAVTPATSVFGQPVTLTATVSTNSPSVGLPSGPVSFKDGATTLCAAVALSSRVATCTVSTLALGTHSVTATYAGDSDFSTSTSASETATVNKAATSTTLTSSANPSARTQ